jgi:GNAT superfamily N-acetyltransferase
MNNNINIRIPRPHELEDLRKIWQSSFSVDDKRLFFTFFYNPELCRVVIIDNTPVAMGFLVPVGNLKDSTGQAHPCAFIYALATLPEFRDRGFASAVVKHLTDAGVSAGYTAIALCPSEDSLFEYYTNNSPFCDWFYCIERFYEPVDIAPTIRGAKAIKNAVESSGTIRNTVEISKISAEKYADLQAEILRKYMPDGSCYIEMSAFALRYQEKLCAVYGGGLYHAKLNGDIALLTVELHPDKTVRIKELLCPAEHERDIISAISQIYPARRYMARTPVRDARDTASVKKFAMLSASLGVGDIITPPESSAPWCGLAFD